MIDISFKKIYNVAKDESVQIIKGVIYHMIKDMESNINPKERYKPVYIGLLILFVLVIVYITGGTKDAYLHLIYLPIILSAYYWGAIGGLIVGVVSGFLLGLLPMDVAKGISQSTISWVYRTFLFTIIGYVTGVLFEMVYKLNERLKDKEFISDLTGLFNSKKLFKVLKCLIDRDETFSIVSVKLTNIDGIGKYVKYELVHKLVKELIEDIKLEFKDISMYSSSYDEIILIFPEDCAYIESFKSLVEKYSKAVNIDGFHVDLPMKIGIYLHKGGPDTPIDVYNKARIASEQGEIRESGIYYYDIDVENSRKEMFEIAGSLHDAIVNEEFYLVYQPKINIIDNTITGVEVLLRWDRGERKPIGPNIFIDIAEKTGFIKEISKYVIENTIKQMEKWEKEGIDITYSINITGQELINHELIDWITNIINLNNIDRSKIELEITERVLSKENEIINKRLNYLKEIGYKIAIDDFGTGYNSMMMIGTLSYDILKIDKFFLDRIGNFENRMLIKNIIEYTHALKKIVVAEGVETEEQIKYLREYGCDEVQGYYFSKPLLPDDFVKFYKDFYKVNVK